FDPCACRCHYVWTTVTEMQTRCRTVYERVPVTQTVTCNVVTCTPVQRQGMRTECIRVPVVTDVVCDVVKCTPVQRQGMRTECIRVPVVQDIVCDVVKCTPVQKQGVRKECKTVSKTRPVTINECTYKTEKKTEMRQRVICNWVTETVPQK